MRGGRRRIRRREKENLEEEYIKEKRMEEEEEEEDEGGGKLGGEGKGEFGGGIYKRKVCRGREREGGGRGRGGRVEASQIVTSITIHLHSYQLKTPKWKNHYLHSFLHFKYLGSQFVILTSKTS